MSALLTRSVRASLFNRSVHDEVRYEQDATADAAMIVVGVSVVSFVVASIIFGRFSLSGLVLGLIQAAVLGLAQWLFLGLATWFVGTRLFGGEGDMQIVLRAHGLVYLPLLLAIFGSVGAVVAQVWLLAAASVATSAALTVDVRRGAFSVLTGAAILAVVSLLFRAPLFIGF